MENFQYMFIEGVGSFELGVCFLVGVGVGGLACVLLLNRSPPIMLIIEYGIGSIFQLVVTSRAPLVPMVFQASLMERCATLEVHCLCY
jgi:hypothetical protein